MTDISSTIRVHPDGSVERGIKVPRTMRRGHEERFVAGQRRSAKRARSGYGELPKGVDQTITLPHDCEKHLWVPSDVE